jgi:hypothetical protein
MSRDGTAAVHFTAFPYSSPASSAATLVEEKQQFQEIDLGLPKKVHPSPPEGIPDEFIGGPQPLPPQNAAEQPTQDGPPPPDLGVKILEGWALGLTVFTSVHFLFVACLR